MKCRKCGKEIVFMITKKGKRMPVDISSVSAGETSYNPGKHVSHFATCPEADTFRGKK